MSDQKRILKNLRSQSDDELHALSKMEAGATQNKPEDQLHLGFYYQFVNKDDKQAFKCYLAAANQDHPSAQFHLAKCYEKGIGITQDYGQAFIWYLKAANNKATSDRHPLAQFQLARFYEHGIGVEQNAKEAFKWYQAAAVQGHEQAVSKLKTYHLVEKKQNKTHVPKAPQPESPSASFSSSISNSSSSSTDQAPSSLSSYSNMSLGDNLTKTESNSFNDMNNINTGFWTMMNESSTPAKLDEKKKKSGPLENDNKYTRGWWGHSVSNSVNSSPPPSTQNNANKEQNNPDNKNFGQTK